MVITKSVIGLLCFCLLSGCSSGDSGGDRASSGAGGVAAIGGAGGMAGTMPIGGAGAGGNSGSGGGGGTGGSLGGTGGTGNDNCAETSAEAELMRSAADIIWVIDNSESMEAEAAAVQANMNTFAQTLFDNGIDVHLVLISSGACSTPNDIDCGFSGFADGHGVCIAAPFGSGMCYEDSKPPNYLHVNKLVDSYNGLRDIINEYPNYQNMLRPNASKHFVIVTDDNSNLDAAMFSSMVTALDPVLFASWHFHGIFSFTMCPDADNIGAVYQELVTQTNGVAGDLCTQMFAPVFEELATDVVLRANIACDWVIPPPPMGMTLDPSKVNVKFTQPNGTVVPLGKIPEGEECSGREGWYYDRQPPQTPTIVLACPASCDLFQSTGGKVDVAFGCDSIPAPPLE